MLHEHNLIDNDVHFIISDTGEINLLSDNKDSIIYIQQFLHLSESFTFEAPRYIEGHDMSLSNIVNIHFTNIDSKTKEESKDIYPVDGLKVDEQDENKIIFTCKLKDTCTRYVGLLKFSIIFECYEDDVVIYRWPTDIFSKIMIRRTNYNSGSIVIEHSDIISEIQNDIGQLSEEKADNPSTGKVGQIIAILTVDENGKPTSYQAIDKPSGAEISTEGLQEAVNNYLAKNPVSGLSVKEKETLLALFKSIEYTGDMSATVKRLGALFAGEEGISYTITYNLTNVTSSDSDTTIVEGTAKTITLTADEGFILDEVTVTMNGEDITSSVYTDGVITIASATGDIVITANAKVASVLEPVYTLAEETVFDGTNSVDTGYRLFDEDKDWSLVVEFSSSSSSGYVFSESKTDGNTNVDLFGLEKFSGWYWRPRIINATVSSNNNCYTGSASNAKIVFTRTLGSNEIVMYVIKDGAKITDSITTSDGINSIMGGFIGKTNTLKLGFNSDANDGYFTGTIHDFKVYERILETTEINGYLGV